MSWLLLSLLACPSTPTTTTTAPPAPKSETVSTPPATEVTPTATRPEKPGLDIPAPADVAAPPADAARTSSGLAYKVLTPGSGTQKPSAKDKVEVNYTGWTTDGKAFDSTSKRGKPASFGLDRVIAGWTEGVQLMVVGEKTRFWIPQELAYKGAPGKPAGMLVFDIELLSVTEAPKPIPAPDDVAEPPKSAKRTKSGIAYRVLEKGKGKERPTEDSVVVVEYTGWMKDGTMFDSSTTRGKPASFALKRVIPGWTEGVQLMTVGEKTRFWIPAELAYGETSKRPGGPSGQLTFDIELKGIKDKVGDGGVSVESSQPKKQGQPIKR